jgi:hypothetical protein
VTDVAAVRTELQANRASLLSSIRGLNEEQFRFVPDSETWSIAAHLAHLLRTERLFSERATAAVTRDEPHMPSTRVSNDDDPALASRMAVPQIIHGMQATRRSLERVLEGGDSVLERAIIHERLGRMSVRDIAVKMSSHEAEHAAEIERLGRLAPAGRVTIPLAPRS